MLAVIVATNNRRADIAGSRDEHGVGGAITNGTSGRRRRVLSLRLALDGAGQLQRIEVEANPANVSVALADLVLAGAVSRHGRARGRSLYQVSRVIRRLRSASNGD